MTKKLVKIEVLANIFRILVYDADLFLKFVLNNFIFFYGISIVHVFCVKVSRWPTENVWSLSWNGFDNTWYSALALGFCCSVSLPSQTIKLHKWTTSTTTIIKITTSAAAARPATQIAQLIVVSCSGALNVLFEGKKLCSYFQLNRVPICVADTRWKSMLYCVIHSKK